MKKALFILIVATLFFSFAACTAAPAEETPSPTPEATPVATLEPTEEPTPTLEPTPEPYTEGQQWYFDCMEYKEMGQNDIYAICQAMIAYKNGELDSFIDSGEIKAQNIEWLKEKYTLVDVGYISIEDDFLSGSYGDRELSKTETVLAIFRGDNINSVTYQLSSYSSSIGNIFDDGYSFISVFPEEESRKKVSKVVKLFDEINGKDISELEQLLSDVDLRWTEGWYVIKYIHPENSYETQVINNGMSVSYLDYISESDFSKEFLLKTYVIIEENFNKIAMQPSSEWAKMAEKYLSKD